jgi:lysophospholipid acyltransferase (LPLAT)-like uncharacterized protein
MKGAARRDGEDDWRATAHVLPARHAPPLPRPVAGGPDPPGMLKRLLRHPRTLSLGAALLARHLRLVAATTRWTVAGRARAEALRERPVIGAFWHEQLALAHAVAWDWSGARQDTGFTVLVSRHRDGRLIGDVVARLGIGAAHGSSRRGAVAVFREAQRALAEGRSVAITPDGPRGPRRVAQPGVARLARLTGTPVIPVGVAVSRARRLGSWDRMIFPLPFGSGAIAYGEPVFPHALETEEAMLARISSGMTEAAEEAARLAGSAVPA